MAIKKAIHRALFGTALFGTAFLGASICAAQTYGSGTYGGGLYNVGSGGGADVTPPTVSMTAPAPGTLGGSSVTLSAIASDDTALASIQFKIDTNTLVGSAGSASPYSVNFDSTSVSNGSHTIIAVARDSSGNYATSSGVTITVSNTSVSPIVYAGGGGGGGGGGPIIHPYASTSPVFLTPVSIPVKASSAGVIAGIPPKARFTQTLTVTPKGEQVRWLQLYLNSHGFKIAFSGPGSPGKETSLFGYATQAALAKFQKAHGLKPPIGYFGPATRAYINSTLPK